MWARRTLALCFDGEARSREDVGVAWAGTGRRGRRRRVKEGEGPRRRVRCVQRTRRGCRVRANSGYRTGGCGGRRDSAGQGGVEPLLDGLHRRTRCAHGIGARCTTADGLSSLSATMSKHGRNDDGCGLERRCENCCPGRNEPGRTVADQNMNAYRQESTIRYIRACAQRFSPIYALAVPLAPSGSVGVIVIFTWLNAASAFCKSLSLKLLNAPPPGVLTPECTDPARERTFMTNGLSRVSNDTTRR